MELKKLGRYEINEVLGQGAMGIVYKGVDPKIGRTVALKTLKTTSEIPEQQLAEFKRRFSQEAQSAGRLTHPNIVTIYDVGEEEGLAYIAMEFIKGKPLDDLIAQKHPLSVDQIVKIMVQICDGLGYAHKNGVIHRDIKPANIILTDDQVAKITDFGIAKISSNSATQTGLVVGTPSYMSPEQITGKPIDNRSDIFSLGAVFYELLTYEKAFPGDNITTVMYRVVHENPTPINIVNMMVPTAFGQIIQKSMAKNPNDRYPDAESLGKDIQNYKTVATEQMGATQVLRTGDMQATMVMSGDADMAKTTVFSGQTMSEAAKPEKKKTGLIITAIVAVAVIIGGWFIFGKKSGANDSTSNAVKGTASLTLTLNALEGVVQFDTLQLKAQNGKVDISGISAAEHELTIKHDGYQDFKTKLLFAENEQKKFNVDLKLSPTVFPEGVDTAYITVDSKPEVIKVLTNTGKFIGYTPIQKMAFPTGKHTLVFSRENYISEVTDIDLKKGKEQKLSPALDFKKGGVSVTDVTPKTIQLLVNEIAFKPEKDGTTYLLPVGKQNIVIKADGFKTYEQEVEIKEKETVKITATLEQLFGKLSVTSDPSGADVFIDGKNAGKTPLNLDKIPAGTREIKVQKGALLSIRKVAVNDAQESKADFKLAAAVGFVKLLVNPWANVFIDGKNMGVTPPLDNLELKPGTYKIKIENPAFKPVTKTITVTAGGTATLQHDFK
ncbi:PEGA domain-containing protein [bacterium]|nr:PEGA domain-containing protein [bacterium]